MATAKLRHFVLVEPWRKADVSIFNVESDAVTHYEKVRAEGKQARFVSNTGTVNDLDGILRPLRREFMEATR